MYIPNFIHPFTKQQLEDATVKDKSKPCSYSRLKDNLVQGLINNLNSILPVPEKQNYYISASNIQIHKIELFNSIHSEIVYSVNGYIMPTELFYSIYYNEHGPSYTLDDIFWNVYTKKTRLFVYGNAGVMGKPYDLQTNGTKANALRDKIRTNLIMMNMDLLDQSE
mgnify:FL=1